MKEDERLSDVCIGYLLPGLWQDANGNLHFSIPEIHQFWGFKDTPEGRAKTEQMLKTIMADLLPEAEFISRSEPPAPDPSQRWN